MTTEDLFWFDTQKTKQKQLQSKFNALTRELGRAPDLLKEFRYALKRKHTIQTLQGYNQALKIPNMPYSFTKYLRKKRNELQHVFMGEKNSAKSALLTLTTAPAILARLTYELNCIAEAPEQGPQQVDTTGLDVIVSDEYLYIRRPATVAKLSSTINVPSSVTFEGEACVRIPPYTIKFRPTDERPTIHIYTTDELGFETLFNPNTPNPHCLGSGVPCFGDFISPIQDAFEQRDVHLLVDVVDAFMRQINVTDSAGKQWISILRYDRTKDYNPSNSHFVIGADGVVSNVPNVLNVPNEITASELSRIALRNRLLDEHARMSTARSLHAEFLVEERETRAFEQAHAVVRYVGDDGIRQEPDL